MPKCERYIGMNYSRLCSACISGGTPLPLLGGACVNFTQPAAAGKAVAETAKRPS